MTKTCRPARPAAPATAIRFSRTGPTPDGVPPFDRIAPEHFRPAYARALAEHEAEIAAIAADPAPPSFDNTIAALELSGRALERVGNVFHLLAGAAHQRRAARNRARDVARSSPGHWNKINTNAALFRRIDALMRDADKLGLNAEQKRVLERYHTGFRRAGAALDGAAKKRLAEIIERLAALGTAFSQNVLADEQAFTLRLEGEAELAGLPDFMREAMKSEARERGLDGYAVTLSRSSVEPFLQFSDRRDLREKVFRGFIMRGDNGGATDNKAIIAEMVRLRAERARLLGYADFAHYRLDDAMAKTPAAVRDLLDTVWAPARSRALADRDAMQALIAERRRQFQARALGLALLRREAAPAAVRFRRGRDQALSQSRPHDRGRVLHGAAPVRADASRPRPTCRSGIPTCGSGRCAAPTARRSACSSATISRGRPSAAAPG